MKPLAIVMCCIFILGCEAIKSAGDNVQVIGSSADPIEKLQTPQGFVVKPEEVLSLLPLHKSPIYLYASAENYYLLPTLSLVPGFRCRSSLAQEHGIEIEGISRKHISAIQEQSKVRKPVTLRGLKKLSENTR